MNSRGKSGVTLKGSPQIGFLIKIKANVTKKRKKKRLPLKASWLRTEANVHGAPENLKLHVGRQKGHKRHLSSPPGPPATMPVSAGKPQMVCNGHFGLETETAGERT